jgi:hypothetical protein
MPNRCKTDSPRSRPPGLPAPPRERPRAWDSALWDYLEDIRTWRRRTPYKRPHTWKQVAEELALKGVHVDPATVRRFFQRARKRPRPAGWWDDTPAPPAAEATPGPPSTRTADAPAQEGAQEPLPNDPYWRAVAERQGSNPFTADKRR